MGLLAFEQAVLAQVAGAPHLLPVFRHVAGIPQALRLYSRDYYVVLNVERVLQKGQGLHFREWTPVPPGVVPRWNSWYEVHKLTAPPGSGGVILPFGPLDARAIPHVIERDPELSGDLVLERADRANRLREERLARQRRDLAGDMARDLRTAAVLDSWGPSSFGPGGPARTARPAPARRLVVPMAPRPARLILPNGR